MVRRRWARWRRRTTAAAVVLLVCGAVAAATWQVLALQARDAVAVGADARPFPCRTGSTTTASEDDDPLDPGDRFTSGRAADDGLDARFDVPGAGMDLPAGASVVLLARLRWKDSGCSGDGATTTTGDSPAVTVSVLGTEGVRTPQLASWAFRGKDRADCR